MTRFEKLYMRVASAPANARFEDLVHLAEAVGFAETRTTGSHRILRHSERPELQLNLQPLQGQAKVYQVKQLLAMIEREGLRG